MKEIGILRNIWFSFLIGVFGSLMGAALAGVYAWGTFYWELYQQAGEHMFDMGLMPPNFKAIFFYTLLLGLPFAIPISLILGVPLAYSLRKQIAVYPKTTILTALAIIAMIPFAFMFVGGSPAFGGVAP
jgi:hypothetical protein